MTPSQEPRPWLRYKYLSAWLDIATWGLSDDSRARVEDEITAHFHDAIDEGVRAGLAEDLAAERAVESLGSPNAAGRAFHRTYLTRYQAVLVRSLAEPPMIARLLRVYLVVAATFLTVVFPRSSGPEWYVSAGMTAFMVIAAIVLLRVPGLYRRGRQRAAIALGAGAEGLLWVMWLAFVVLGSNNLERQRWLLIAGFFWMVMVGNYMPLLRKLRNQPRREPT
jgi:hypothetical protein